MRPKQKADVSSIGSRNDFNGKLNSAFSYLNCTAMPTAVQCRKCGSDYMRYAVEGFCQRCQQRAEFFRRDGRKGQPANGQRRPL